LPWRPWSGGTREGEKGGSGEKEEVKEGKEVSGKRRYK